jgi:hypothetical protein
MVPNAPLDDAQVVTAYHDFIHTSAKRHGAMKMKDANEQKKKSSRQGVSNANFRRSLGRRRLLGPAFG